ncbi:MAG: MMPL family transporter [Propionicimonas sp.]
MSAYLYRLGRACFRFRGRVLAAWLALLVVLGLAAAAFGGSYDDAFEIPGASSQIALASLKVTFPEAADASASVVIGAPPGDRITNPDVRKAIEAYLDDLDALPYVKGTQSPFTEYIDGLISPDYLHALIRVRVEGTVSTFTDEQRADLTEHAMKFTETLPGSTVNVGGDVFSIHLPELTLVEGLGVVVAIIVLLVTLGSVVAAMMPIGAALAGVALGAALVMIAAGIISVSSTTLMLVVMLALAVGIDYALFIISRHRDQLAEGLDVEESVARAVATAGSAVVFAGLTVIIALVGLSIAGLPFLAVMGVFTAVTVAFEVLLALTLLPALLGYAGERLRPKPRAPEAEVEARSGRSRHGGASAWWVRVVTKRPLVTVLVVLVGMGALALPARDIQLALPNSGRAAPGAPDRITFDLITSQFGIGFNGPLVVTGSIVESDEPMDIIEGVRDDIAAMPGVKLVAAALPNANADTALIQIVPTTGPDDPATADLVERLRARHDEWQQRFAFDTAVTGLTAAQIDVTTRLRDALAPFGIFVVGLSLVLLAMAFRSIWVPIKAGLGYLFSVTAAFGATTLVFNKGWFAQLVNLPEPGPVISFLPIILMGILFGLAMDYEVFLTSRMREEFVHGNTDRWVEDGFIHSAKVVVAAALIMFAVFAFFVPSGIGVIKPIAFSLAAGVALDAFLIRMTLGPAVMKMMGERAWWLPRWLDRRMPVLDVEGEALAHQVGLADWPTADAAAAIHAEGLSAEAGGQRLFADVAIDLPRGGVLVVEGEHVQRLALMYGLSGRLRLNGGEAKVMGRVLPEEAPLVRLETLVLQPTTAGFERELHRGRGRIVFIDSADELGATAFQALSQALATRPADSADGKDTTWVIGIMPGTDVGSIVTVPHATLELTSHLARAASQAGER